MTICSPDHKHAASSTCHKNHKCRCVPCVTAERVRNTRVQKARRRQKAYGQYNGLISAVGTQRRIQGLQWLGWTLREIGTEAGGVSDTNIALILKRDQVEPATAETIRRAFAVLIARGQGGSNITRIRAQRKGFVSPFVWENIDTDSRPMKTKRNRVLRGAKLFAEIDHLRDGGESAHQIAKTFDKTAAALERASYNAGRKDLAAFFHQAAEPRQYPSRRAEYGSEHRERGAA